MPRKRATFGGRGVHRRYYHAAARYGPDEIDQLPNDVVLAASWKKEDPWHADVPKLRIVRTPGPNATSRQMRKYREAIDDRVAPEEFASYMRIAQLDAVVDTNGYWHTPDSLNRTGWDRVVGNVPVPQQRNPQPSESDAWR